MRSDARDASAVNLVGGTSFDYLAAMRRGIAFANDGACCQVALSQVFFCMNLPCAMVHACAPVERGNECNGAAVARSAARCTSGERACETCSLLAYAPCVCVAG